METFSSWLALCAGNSPVTGEFPTQRPVMRSFDVFYDLRLKKRSKQPWGWWFEMPSHPLWRHSNDVMAGDALASCVTKSSQQWCWLSRISRSLSVLVIHGVYIVRYDNDGQKQGWFCISVNESFITEHVCDFAYLHNGISYTDKTTFLYWIKALVFSHWLRPCSATNNKMGCG